jgi:hypothetical protein
VSNRLQRENGPNGAREPSQRRRRIHPALKHGGYSGMDVLPGEDPAEFETLHNELVAEYAPTARHEHEIVETMARLMWRKRCLWSYGLAEFARKRHSAIELAREKAGETRSHEIWIKKCDHREKVDDALEQYRAEKDAKGEPLSREEMQQIEAQYADPDVAAEEEYDELWFKVIAHPKHREHTAQQQAEEEKIRREMGDAAFELARLSQVATTGYLMHELSIIDRIDAMIDRCLKRLLLVRGVKSISPSLSKPTPKQIPSS